MNDVRQAIKVTKIQDIAEKIINHKQDFLMNRATLGIPLREYLFGWIKENRDPGVTFVLDFEGILEASISVAEEIGPILFNEFMDYREIVPHSLGDLFLAYGNLSTELVIALERTFSGWSVAHPSDTLMVTVGLKTIREGKFKDHIFLGGPQLPSSLAEILNMIYRHGDMTSNELELLGVKAPSRKLNEIIDRCSWLVRKTRVRLEETEKGWTYVYSPILPIQNDVLGEERR